MPATMQNPACMTIDSVSRHESLTAGPCSLVPSKDIAEELDVPPKEPGGDTEQEAEKPYSIYTFSEKWFIVSMASLAALLR